MCICAFAFELFFGPQMDSVAFKTLVFLIVLLFVFTKEERDALEFVCLVEGQLMGEGQQDSARLSCNAVDFTLKQELLLALIIFSNGSFILFETMDLYLRCFFRTTV